MARTRPCSPATMDGRRRKAEQFLDAAATIMDFADDGADVGDAYVTLCVHAGIAAADVICCRAHGVHAYGESHADAVDLLRRSRPDGDELAAALSQLLAVKTRAGYGEQPVNADQRTRAWRRAEKLVAAARG